MSKAISVLILEDHANDDELRLSELRDNHLSQRKRLAFITTTLIVILMIVYGGSACQSGYSGQTESITIGTLHVESAGLIFIAQDGGLFTDNGLSVTIKEYDTGVAALDALLKDEVDIAYAAEFPFVRRAFEKKKISIIGVMDKFSYFYLFGRRDRGIEKPSNLKGKKIGVTRGSIAEFYLGRYLELNGLAMPNVTVVDVGGPKMVEAISSGSVDGVATWEPFVHQIKLQMADQVVIWPVQNNQPAFAALIGRNDWLAGHKEPVNRFLKSLAQAEEYLIHQPAGAKAIVQKRMNYDDAFMETVWVENQFFLSFDESLIVAMEDEARWMIRNQFTSEKQVPDFLDYLYLDGLQSVKPEAVNIIR